MVNLNECLDLTKKVVSEVSNIAKGMKVAAGLTSPDMGPLVSKEQFEKVQASEMNF